MRFTIEVDYDDDSGEDAGAVALALAEIMYEQDDVANVRAGGLMPTPDELSMAQYAMRALADGKAVEITHIGMVVVAKDDTADEDRLTLLVIGVPARVAEQTVVVNQVFVLNQVDTAAVARMATDCAHPTNAPIRMPIVTDPDAN